MHLKLRSIGGKMAIIKKIQGFLVCCVMFNAISYAKDISANYIKETLLKTKSLCYENEIIEHLQEAKETNQNPVILAFQKNNVELAELLLRFRKIELSIGIETFDFPGYKFKKMDSESGEEEVVWLKQAPIRLVNQNEELYVSESKVNVEILKLLMKYDDQNIWTAEIHDIMQHAYQRCDLEGVLFCLQMSYDKPEIDLTSAISKPRYLIDPFLSEIQIDLSNPTHFYNDSQCPAKSPYLWDFRPDDNMMITEIKKQIQFIISEKSLV